MVIFNNIILILEKYWGLFLQGIGVTLMLSAIAVAFGILIGSLLALMRLSKFHIGRFRPLDFIATIYVEIIRGTPLLLQLYFFFFLLPMMIPALETSAQFSITLALCLNSGAYVAEVIRAGISAVDKGQTEAARSLGLNARQTMLKNRLPAGGQKHPACFVQRICFHHQGNLSGIHLLRRRFDDHLQDHQRCHLSVHRATDYRRYHLLPADLHPVQRNRCTGKEIKNK